MPRAQVLDSIGTFPTSTVVCIITNQPVHLASSGVLSQYPNTSTCGKTDNITHPYMLAWAHRDVMHKAWKEGTALPLPTQAWTYALLPLVSC